MRLTIREIFNLLSGRALDEPAAWAPDRTTTLILDAKAKKRALKQAFVLGIDCRGCMAEDHQILWIGRVIGFEDESVEIELIKSNQSGDIRDEDIGRLYEIITNGDLQFIVPGLFARYY